MEFCSGGDLSNYIRQRGRVEGLEYVPSPSAAPQFWPHPKSGGLDPVVVRCFLGQLARALKFLRDRNLIHRDIKPQNLLLDPAPPGDANYPVGIPILKIADFGFARSLPNAAMAETLCGSPLYMAPEILRYQKYDAKADLWSVGAVLYEMSVGKPPFRAQNHIELLKKIDHARGRVSFPDEVAAKEAAAAKEKGLSISPKSTAKGEITVVPSDIKELVRMLLKRKPVERASFEEFFASHAIREQLDMSTPNANGVMIPTPSSTVDDSGRQYSGDSISHRSHRDRRDKDLAERDSSPLEGTPYDPKLYTPQSEFRFRRRPDEDFNELDANGVAGPSTPPRPRSEVNGPSALTAEPSLLNYSPATRRQAEEDGANSKEYVLVEDTRAVEFYKAADEIESVRKRPSNISRTTSAGMRGAQAAAALTKQVGKMVIGAALGNGTHPSTPSRATPPSPSYIPTTIGAEPHETNAIPDNLPPFATKTRRSTDQSSAPATPATPVEDEATPPPTPITFPPPPNPNPPAPSVSNPLLTENAARYSPYGQPSQPSALVRAINLASKKLFGSPTNLSSSPSNPSVMANHRTNLILSDGINGSSEGGGSPRSGKSKVRSSMQEAEDKVLAEVENIAQKAEVLKQFADGKFNKVETHSNRPLDPAKFARKAGEPSSRADSRRKKEVDVESVAVQTIALYLAVMGFCQKGINDLKKYCQTYSYAAAANEESSTGIDDALVWFRDTFKSCVERSEVMKAYLPEGHQSQNMWIDRVIYDHALALMRHAASKELVEDNYAQIEKEYERALWMLYAIADDVLQEGNPYRNQDIQTINGFIDNTKTRLMRLRKRMEEVEQRRREIDKRSSPRAVPAPSV
ncbi:Serine/threonine-protein kinase [Tulasnella sp. 418]|nr:Serine/threonine-protein kinase [Tulasnella sp. 418]